jgi:hypothetical protein
LDYLERQQTEAQSIEAAAHSKGRLSADEMRELPFEALASRAEDVLGPRP